MGGTFPTGGDKRKRPHRTKLQRNPDAIRAQRRATNKVARKSRRVNRARARA